MSFLEQLAKQVAAANTVDDELTDEQRFDANGSIVREWAEVLLSEFYGERCPDFEPGCLCCQKWAALDGLLENPLSDGLVPRTPRYVKFTDAAVARTVPSPCGTTMVDLAADGSVVGVEMP